VEVPLPPRDRVTLETLSEIAGPEGDIEAARLMVPLNPFKLLSVIVEEPEEPAVMVKLLGPAVMTKSGWGEGLTVTVRVIA
jgi:hypothetical protein